MPKEYDICIVGSGAGAAPVAYELSKAGYRVVVLEKGPWIKREHFTKDEITAIRRSVYTPSLKDEPQVIESPDGLGGWIARSNYDTGNDFWNGNMVGGSSNLMSGYFHRMKPMDFRLLSTYDPIPGADIADWPITYDDLEPYYTKVEREVGVSGRVIRHDFQEKRSTPDFPYPPLQENIVSSWLDRAAEKLGFPLVPVPRAILSKNSGDRHACYYSNYCGSYGCSSGAKGSARESLLNRALKTGNCEIIAHAKVFHLETDGKGTIVKALYYDKQGKKQSIHAGLFVVAAQAIETSRLLLMSKNPEFPDGLSNNGGNVGKNLLFSGGGTGSGELHYSDFPAGEVEMLKKPGVFVNRSLHQWYEFTDPESQKTMKGGTVDFLFEHANPMPKAIRQKWDANGNLLFGKALKEKIHRYFTEQRKIKFEVFTDWLPNKDCFVSLDPEVKDKWGDPVARIRPGNHPHDLKVGRFLARKAEQILAGMGAKNIESNISGGAPSNLQAGGCCFGNDPATSVLDKNCKSYEVSNLYVTDGSFMPTGGSVTYTWTIYANAFRVADIILKELKK